MRPTFRYASAAAIAALLAAPVTAQTTTGPKERYEMDVATMSGFAAMGGGKGGMGGAMSMMFGGGPDNAIARQLFLRLGSNEAPTAPPPKGDHFFVPQAKLGKSVPLISPERKPGEYPHEFERPKGRLLLYWGCGAKAGPGQPVIVDFAKVAAGQIPPGLFSSAVPVIREVSPDNSRSYVEWPNRQSTKQPARDSSLLGAHRVASNIGSDINFTLAQDYMPGLQASTAIQPDGSVTIRWNSVPAATGYAAWAFGGMDKLEKGGDIVWWSSSATKEFGGGLWDWLPPPVVAKLIDQKIVMPPSQTSCQIPAEAKKASGEMMVGNLNAFGPEANFAYPPKPAGNAAWNIDWTAKVRFRSYTMLMVGVDLGGMGAGAMGGGESGQPAEPPKKKKCRGPLGIPLPDGAC
ncbi:MAG TPA: hypothetical protein PKD99_12215 [Sphingopyxis sp.]|nr:hypothetical protein [Sphingopyxis sp.]HMP45863.1 hypothetical protein [Sphingopyxis sp.]